MTTHPYSIEDRRQPDEPTPAEEAFEIACADFTLEEFAERFDECFAKGKPLHDAFIAKVHQCALAGDTNKPNAGWHCEQLWEVCKDAIRSDMIEDDRNERAQAKYLAEAE